MNSTSQQILLVVLGALTGILSTLLGSAFKAYLDRKVESTKAWAALRLEYLDPLRIAAQEFRDTVTRIYETSSGEKDIAEVDLKDSYNLRWWFRRCKDYVIDRNDDWTDEQRLGDFAMHSGGMGYDAMSTLYVTASYLYYATKIRSDVPYTKLRGDESGLLTRINNVRSNLGKLEYYPITQDSTGIAMRSSSGELLNFREFGEAITSKSKRGWFLTLTDVYFKMHTKSPGNIENLTASIDDLIIFLNKNL
jgi:hypothetical protein